MNISVQKRSDNWVEDQNNGWKTKLGQSFQKIKWEKKGKSYCVFLWTPTTWKNFEAKMYTIWIWVQKRSVLVQIIQFSPKYKHEPVTSKYPTSKSPCDNINQYFIIYLWYILFVCIYLNKLTNLYLTPQINVYVVKLISMQIQLTLKRKVFKTKAQEAFLCI